MYLPAGISGMHVRQKEQGTVITRKPIVPGEEELEYNKRSKSSKLRVFERA